MSNKSFSCGFAVIISACVCPFVRMLLYIITEMKTNSFVARFRGNRDCVADICFHNSPLKKRKRKTLNESFFLFWLRFCFLCSTSHLLVGLIHIIMILFLCKCLSLCVEAIISIQMVDNCEYIVVFVLLMMSMYSLIKFYWLFNSPSR